MNPFLINNYISPEYFCNREQETKLLIKNIENQNNTTFFAQRRIGKTALIHHVFYQLKKKQQVCIYLDIFATRELKNFANQLAGAIYSVFPIQHSIGKQFWDNIKLLRPSITFSELTGLPELSLDITKPNQIEKSIPQLLQFLDKQNTPIVIAIDEFQQILEYPENNIEALLRTVIQSLKNVRFVFLGSDRNMMLQIFNNAKRPFYASTKNLYIDKINGNEYALFIKKLFKKNNISIEKEIVYRILEITHAHTYFTQRLCNEIYANAIKKVDEIMVTTALNTILLENESVYFQYRNMLTSNQWKVLKAISMEEKIEKPYAKKFLIKYKLGSSSMVKRTLDSLINKNLVYHDVVKEKTHYEVQDKFLMRWLQYKR